jgi:hypothetical protein
MTLLMFTAFSHCVANLLTIVDLANLEALILIFLDVQSEKTGFEMNEDSKNDYEKFACG